MKEGEWAALPETGLNMPGSGACRRREETLRHDLGKSYKISPVFLLKRLIV